MKKFFMIAVMAVCALAANAQTPAAGSFKITPLVGVNFSTISNDLKNASLESKVGFAAGVEGLYMTSDNFGISAGVMYSQQGSKFDINTAELKELGVKFGDKLSADYIAIPILAQSYLANGFAVKVGVQPAFKVSDKSPLDDMPAVVREALEKREGADLSINSFDLSIPVGISYEFSNIVLDARYNWGVLDMLKNDNLSGHNNVFQVMVGYRF